MTPEQFRQFIKLFTQFVELLAQLIEEVHEIKEILKGDWTLEEESEESPAPDN